MGQDWRFMGQHHGFDACLNRDQCQCQEYQTSRPFPNGTTTLAFFWGILTTEGEYDISDADIQNYNSLLIGQGGDPPKGTVKEQMANPMFVTKGGVGYGVDETQKVEDDGKGWGWLELFKSLPFAAILVAEQRGWTVPEVELGVDHDSSWGLELEIEPGPPLENLPDLREDRNLGEDLLSFQVGARAPPCG